MDEDKFRHRLKGSVRFSEDMSSKKMVYALLVKAGKTGKLLDTNLPDLPEHIRYFTASDIPGKNTLPYPDANIPLLVEDEILYPGQGIGILTGPNADELYKLRKLIQFTIESRPDFPPAAMEDRNYCPSRKSIQKGNVQRGYQKADDLIEGDYSLTLPELPVYPDHTVYCSKEGGTYVLHLHTQWPSLIRKLTAMAAGISRKQVELHFNSAGRTWDSHIWQSIPAAAMAVCVTSILRQPVKFICEKEKSIPRKIRFKYKAGLDQAGKMTALECLIYLDTGAYGCFSSETASRLCLAAAGLYQCRHIQVEVKCFNSNTAPCLPQYSWGLAQGNYGIEILANQLAIATSHDPAEWRKLNLIVKGNLNSTMGNIRKTPPLADMLENLVHKSDYSRKHAAFRQVKTNTRGLEFTPSSFTGIGMAIGRQGSEFLSRDRTLTAASVSMTLQKEGYLDVHLGTVPGSPGILAIWKKNISAQLSIDEKQINLIQDLADEQSFNGPSCLSRNALVFTKLIDQCCGIIQKKRFREALPITETRSFRRRTNNEWNEKEMIGTPFSAASCAVIVVEVSLYTATKEISIPRIYLSIHCGPLLDKNAARSSLEAEVRMALVHCMNKQAIKPSIFPDLSIEFVEDNTKQSSGLEGIVLSCLPAAFVQALSQANGNNITSLPIDSASLLREVSDAH